jgi:uncharacterized membrane protein YhiD involved in acid resistance
MGLSVGLGSYDVALVLSLVTLLTLLLLSPIREKVERGLPAGDDHEQGKSE